MFWKFASKHMRICSHRELLNGSSFVERYLVRDRLMSTPFIFFTPRLGKKLSSYGVYMGYLLSLVSLFFNRPQYQKPAISTDYPVVHQRRYMKATYNNPIGNVLPYQGVSSGTFRVAPEATRLTHGMIQSDPLGRKLGVRQYIPVEPQPDKSGHAIYSYGERLRSCKSNRMECIPNST